MPNDGYFNIKNDVAFTNGSGFFCEGCLISKPVLEVSPDPRYCQRCYDFLTEEAKVLKDSGSWKRHPAWLPQIPKKRVEKLGKVSGDIPLNMSIVNDKKNSMDIIGARDRRIRNIWGHIKFRCLSPNSKDYKYYGGRGITVCDEWLDYDNFERWALSNGYGDDLTIDRIDNDKGYSPDNCQWITRGENVSRATMGRKATGAKRGPKSKELPEDLIAQLANDMGSVAIATRLKKEYGIKVGYKTVQRILTGKRK